MGDSFNWRCPFCDHDVTITDERYSSDDHTFDNHNKYGRQVLSTTVIVCPNKNCREYTLIAFISDEKWTNQWERSKPKERWQLIPPANIKVFPDYVPMPILADYKEACLIKDLSPKASATLSRRCLQGMIRDFWGVSKSRLVDEIKGIQEKVDKITWDAIDSVRNIGNIGAHMEKDINLIIDVDQNEAGLLIELVETLIKEWYVNRFEREQRMASIISIASAKKSIKSNKDEDK